MIIEETSFEGRFAKRSRPLIHALIISVALNLGLLATFMTFILKEKKVETLLHVDREAERKVQSSQLSSSNAEVLDLYSKFSFSELVGTLENRELLEQGYYRSDLALACLVTYHHFDLERALPGMKLQKRPFTFGEETIELIPGLNEEKFQVIHYFARFEKWPLTNVGLFEEMVRCRNEIPQSLEQTFFLSKEFHSVERAFSRLPFILTKETLLHLLLDGSYKQLEQVVFEIDENPRGEIPSFGAFLEGYEQSKLAAYLLVALDSDYAYTKLSDERLKVLISFFDQKTPEVELFLSRIAQSARSDEMREKATNQVLSWGGELKKTQSSFRYIIQKGDSLWGLSRQFDTSMENLREANGLQSDLLTPGKVLTIPHGSRNEDKRK